MRRRAGDTMMLSTVWRPDDEALLRRLENEELLLTMWRDATPPHSPPPHSRASGLLQLFRESIEGDRAARAAMDGDLAPMRTLLRPNTLTGMRPELLHHLALFFGAVARANGEDNLAHDAFIRATAAWIALGTEGAYLSSLASTVGGDALTAAELHDVALRAPIAQLVQLEEQAREVAGERGSEAKYALRLLRSIDDAVRISGSSGPVVDRARATAARLHTQLIDTALRALADALDEVDTQEPGDAHLHLFAQTADAWRWAGRDDLIEKFILDRAMGVSWELYNAKRWSPLRRLCDSLRDPVDSLANRVESDPAMLPYAARCAQMLVFRAEMLPKFDAQLATAERAVSICQTHRNGRLVFADLLAERALRTLETATAWERAGAIKKARRDVMQAKSLWPDLAKVKSAEDTLERMGVTL